MHSLSRRQLAVLVVLTLVWGLNWPIMKAGIADLPPLLFRLLSMWLGLPCLAAVMLATRTPFAVPRSQRRELLRLSMTNMVGWYILAMLALPMLSSGRAAILGYTMPIFAAVLGTLFFGERLARRGWIGTGAAALGVALLLWHEFTNLSGRPLGVVLMLSAAAIWALGTLQLRRSTLALPTLTAAFWMTVLTTLAVTVLSVIFEYDQWRMPDAVGWGAIVYNAALVFGFAQPAWLTLARALPPIASTLSVMFIPVLGVLMGALLLGEVLHWQDGVAIALVVVAIASVLLPARRPPAEATA